jgi:molybdopterin converting factor small subunit
LLVKVTVVPLAWLEKVFGAREMILELPDGAVVADALRALQYDEIEYASVVLNSAQISEDAPLSDGDRLYVFPPIAGG